jgi:hypothetical protein
MHIRFKKYLF